MCDTRRLITFIDIDETAGPESNSDRRLSVSALHELELTDGRRLTLLDRGWAASGPSPIWSYESVETLTQTARTVVGPDEPFDGRSYEEGSALHWAYLTGIAQAQGVRVEAGELAALAHDVDISPQIRARLTDVPNPE